MQLQDHIAANLAQRKLDGAGKIRALFRRRRYLCWILFTGLVLLFSNLAKDDSGQFTGNSWADEQACPSQKSKPKIYKAPRGNGQGRSHVANKPEW